MEKILFTVFCAFLSCSSSFCTLYPKNDELLRRIGEWRKSNTWSNFSTDPFKDKLLEEIGKDQHAIEAFNLFHQHKFHELVDYWDQNQNNMISENAERFKEMLLVSAAVIERQSFDGWRFGRREPTCPCVLKIISMAGGDRTAITREIIKHPQFCFEMMFCLAIDADMHGFDKLFQSCEHACGNLRLSLDWQIKEDEVYLMHVFSCIEDANGYCNLRDIWPNWYAGLPPLYPMELE